MRQGPWAALGVDFAKLTSLRIQPNPSFTMDTWISVQPGNPPGGFGRRRKRHPLPNFSEIEIGGGAALALRLAAISRHRIVRPRLAPIGGAFGGPEKIGCARKMRKCPGAIVVDVADKAKFPAFLQYAGHGRNR